jgi:DNA topoisomerase-2
MLEEKGYDKIGDDEEYKYLVKMPMDSVTEENVERLLKDKGNKEIELETIKNTSVYQMWKTELDGLKDLYIEYKDARTRLMNGNDDVKANKKKVVSKGGTVVKKMIKKPLLVVEA